MIENKPLVTVYCPAYNHEKYIRSALEGFVMQKTNFPFEVIVHDDASTDNTAKIIKEYADKYPHIIKPIFQTENQYSNGGKIFLRFILPIARGKYCACCEGDDYWTDENKLQMQVDFLETHPDYSACVHNTVLMNCTSNKEIGIIGCDKEEVTMNDLINWKDQTRFHTSSYLCRMELRKNPPEFLRLCSVVGDYPLALHLRSEGKIYRFNRTMSVYRVLTCGSWSSQQNKLSLINGNAHMINMLEGFNDYTDNKFIDAVKLKQGDIRLKTAEYENRFYDIKNGELKYIYKQKPFKYKFKIFLLQYFPWIMSIKRNLLHQRVIK